jgi:hypothetical protein
VPIGRSAHRGNADNRTRGDPILPKPLQVPYRAPEELPLDVSRNLNPPPVVIKVTRGVDPNAYRDPSRLNDASPFFSTTSQPPRTP